MPRRAPPLTLLALVACDAPPAPVEHERTAIASVEGSIEAVIDAPWRLEAMAPGGPGDVRDVFPAIPLVVSVHDAAQQEDPEVALDVGPFCGVSVHELPNGTPPECLEGDTFCFGNYGMFIAATSSLVREIEVSGPWPATTSGAIGASLCRQWAGDDCTRERDLGPTTEWHATILYTPAQFDPSSLYPYRNGDDVRLDVTAMFAPRGGGCPSPIAHYEAARSDRLTEDGHGYHSVRGQLTIHLAEAPLPRFDQRWAYGDLHYHAQGTDNEGESAYAHRPVLQAMRAMGLDFAFATDHASDSADGQVTDADPVYIDNLSLDLPHFVEDIIESIVGAIDTGVQLPTSVAAARDLHDTRYRYLVDHLNRPDGANAQVLAVAPGRAFAPQLFQGAEVDVVPEVSADEHQRGRLIYGHDFEYWFIRACQDVPTAITQIQKWWDLNLCAHGLTRATPDPNRFTVNDIQIISDQYHARQHLLHLPTTTRVDTFVSGRTSLYGGATRNLSELIQREYVEARKGVVFLAHPADAAFGRGLGRLGPDIVPYSQVQLETAFQSEAVLGLQLWNEDLRRGENIAGPYMRLLLGAQAWDRMLQWGLQDAKTRDVPWLPTGQPRRVFMAGGSDAHGDLNYRRVGYRGGQERAEDTALGKPRNLVFVGDRERRIAGDGMVVGAVSQEQVTTALQSGHFSITDGPALRIVVDTNRNGVVDDTDLPMGSVATLTSDQLPLVVEWQSTPEFGEVADVAIYLGVSDGERTMLYASPHHGVHPPGLGAPAPNGVYLDTSGAEHVSLVGGYMLDPTGTLFMQIPQGQGLHGQRALVLELTQFPVGTLHTRPGEPGACEPNPACNHTGSDEECGLVCEPDAPPTLTFRSPAIPGRAYARAFARTRTVEASPCTGGPCIRRLAYTNPVWAVSTVELNVPESPLSPPGSDGPVAVGGACTTTEDCECAAHCALVEDLRGNLRGTCERRTKDGPCVDSAACVAAAYCASGTCAPRAAIDEPCDRGVPCAPGLACDSRVCVPDPTSTPTCH